MLKVIILAFIKNYTVLCTACQYKHSILHYISFEVLSMELKKLVGERIKECRKIKGLTQKQVSLAMGIVPQQYQTYESGRYELNYQQIVLICKILETSADYILGLTDEY